MNKYDSYILLGKILALDADPDQSGFIISKLLRVGIKWEFFVAMADHHLILQVLYPKIRDHKLLEYFPDGIISHLKYIYETSTVRNSEIFNQTRRLTGYLNKGGITPLYLKGVGNILDGLYKYPGERILHDIDLLVREDQFDLAAETLIISGYKSNYKYDPKDKPNQKHYPILYKPGEPVYVELHSKLTSNKHKKYFNPGVVFESAQKVVAMSDCLVMSDEHKIIHNFLHAQFDHLGHLYAREYMRNLYDLYLLSDRCNPEKIFYDFGHFRRASSGYLDITYQTFDNHAPIRKSPKFFLHFFRFRYFLNIRSRFLGVLSFLAIRIFLAYIVKPFRSLGDKKLRKNLIRKLHDPAWYRKQGKFYKNVLGMAGKKYDK